MAYGVKRGSKKRRKAGKRRRILLLFLISAVSVFCAIGLWNAVEAVSSLFSRESSYDRLILNAGLRNGVDPRLVKAVIWRESRFNHNAKGKKGEIGLMQIMPGLAAADWARVKGYPRPSPGALYDPELNIEIGSWYLGRAMRRWSNFRNGAELALCEYNAGAKRAHEWKPETASGEVRERIGIASTKSYVGAILKRYGKYKKEWKILQ